MTDRRRWTGGTLAILLTSAVVAGFGAGTANGEEITALGTGQATPAPTSRTSSVAIATAVAEASVAAVPRAVVNARIQAAAIAEASGLVLGPVTAVEQQASQYFFYNRLIQESGPNRFCGSVRKTTVRRVDGKRVVRTRKVRECYVPPFVATTLAVTFSATRA